MSPLLKRLYDLSPVPAQNWLLSAFSARLGRQRYGGRVPRVPGAARGKPVVGARAYASNGKPHNCGAVLVHAGSMFRTIRKFSGTAASIRRDSNRSRELRSSARSVTGRRQASGARSDARGAPRCSDAGRRPYQWHDGVTDHALLRRRHDRDELRGHGSPVPMGRLPTWSADGDRVAVVRGNVIVPLTQKKPPFWRFNRDLNQMLLSCFHLSPKNLEAYLQALREFRPTVVDGYPSSLYVLARMLLNSGGRMPIKAAITSSETLYDFQRTAIEEAFCCRVFDYYAAAERVIFSVECGHHTGHHLCEEYGITEVLDDNDQPVPARRRGLSRRHDAAQLGHAVDPVSHHRSRHIQDIAMHLRSTASAHRGRHDQSGGSATIAGRAANTAFGSDASL